MFCINDACEWKGELGSHRIAMVGTVRRCGLCMNPVSLGLPKTAPAVSVPTFDPRKTEATFDGDLSEAAQRVVRRDVDAEEQPDLADAADAEFGD